MAGLSSYAQRMARLSAQIFGEVVRPTDSSSLKVVRLFQEPPLAQRKEVYDWYPQHKIDLLRPDEEAPVHGALQVKDKHSVFC